MLVQYDIGGIPTKLRSSLELSGRRQTVMVLVKYRSGTNDGGQTQAQRLVTPP